MEKMMRMKMHWRTMVGRSNRIFARELDSLNSNKSASSAKNT